MQGCKVTMSPGVEKMKFHKLNHARNLFRKNVQINIIGQRKTYRQGSPGFSCARKRVVDKDILIKHRNGKEYGVSLL